MGKDADPAVVATLNKVEDTFRYYPDNDLDYYQNQASVTGAAWDDKPYNEHRLLLAAGLSGETGEVADRLKKEIGHGHLYDPAKLLEELGDALWYLSEVARLARFPLSLVAMANLAKINRRYPDGFTERASLEREENA